MQDVSIRLLLLLACSGLVIEKAVGSLQVVVLLSALTLSALNGYLKGASFFFVSVLLYTALCAFWPVFSLFLPLVLYDGFAHARNWQLGLFVIPLATASLLTQSEFALVISLTAIAWYLHRNRIAIQETREALTRSRDDSREFSFQLEKRSRELQAQHDYELELTKLNERNRIAREIHDHVGHLLSRSILQLGALQISEQQNPQDELVSLRETLVAAMDSVRASVHDLHDSSLRLKVEVEDLTGAFLFCPLQLGYRLETEPPAVITSCLLAVIKEGLQNISRHSNASEAILTLTEDSEEYRLLLYDNGQQTGGLGVGLGLENMAERAKKLEGRFQIRRDSGFSVLLSLPKKAPSAE